MNKLLVLPLGFHWLGYWYPAAMQAPQMKVRIFPDTVFIGLVLLGVLSLLDEAWKGPAPPALVRFLLAHHLWHLWNELRWQFMYSHEVLHFLSGMFGSLLGCWMYFSFQKRKALPSPSGKDEQSRLP